MYIFKGVIKPYNWRTKSTLNLHIFKIKENIERKSGILNIYQFVVVVPSVYVL